MGSVWLAPLNHLLADNPAAVRLRRHAGKTARFEAFPLSFEVSVAEDGSLVAPAAGTVPDVRLAASPALALRLLARDEKALAEVAITGDAEFGADLAHGLRHLRWDAEEDLSRVFGDVLAHRIVGTGRRMAAWQRDALHGFAGAWVERWTYERPLVVSAAAVLRFGEEVDELRDRIERAQKRVERLVTAVEGRADAAKRARVYLQSAPNPPG